jgi:trk system potassium uptake protein TrkA
VPPQDETNLVCCKVAQLLFNIPTRIARVRTSGFVDEDLLLGPDGFAVDRIICPEESLTRYIVQAWSNTPRPCRYASLPGGRASLVSVRARAGAPLVGHTIGRAAPAFARCGRCAWWPFTAAFRMSPTALLPATGSTRIEPGDEVFVLAAQRAHCPCADRAAPARGPAPRGPCAAS